MIVAELVTKLGFRVDPRELDRGIRRAQSSLLDFKGFLGRLALGAVFYRVARSVVMTARELETMNAQLLTFTGSSEKSQMLFKGITDYAKQTAFYMKDALGATTYLLQGGVNSGDTLGIIRKLGDVAQNSDKLKRLAMAYGRTYSHGFMSGMELNRFQRADFNPAQQLALKAAVEAGLMRKGEEVQKGSATAKFLEEQQMVYRDMIKKKQFTTAMVDEALAFATSKGGMFFEHQKKQLQTFDGAYTNMLDNLSINAGLAFMKLSPVLQRIMNAISAIDMTKLPGMFEKLAVALQYVWKVLVDQGVVAAFEELRAEFGKYYDTLMDAMGGTKGAGNALYTFSVILAATIKLLLGIYTMQVRALIWWVEFLHGKFVYVQRVWAIVRTLASAVFTIGKAIWDFVTGTTTVTNTGLVKFFTLLGYLGRAAQWLAAALQDTLTFTTKLAFAPLYGLVKILWEAAKAANALGRALLALETQETKNARYERQATAAEKILTLVQQQSKYRKEHGGKRDPMLDDQIAMARAQFTAIGEEGMGGFEKFSQSMAADIKESKKVLEEIAKSNGKIADHTAPRGGGFNEMDLLNTALRGRLPDQLMFAIAEYD